jgi:hypothetical protein
VPLVADTNIPTLMLRGMKGRGKNRERGGGGGGGGGGEV